MTKAQYISQEKYDAMEVEYDDIKKNRIPVIARKIDEAKQLGDLSENAEYHSARDEMAWAKSRIQEIQVILQTAEIIDEKSGSSGVVSIGSTIEVEKAGKQKTYQIVGAQEAAPLEGKISNESPMGSAFLGKSKGDTASVETPAGTLEFTILSVS